jgi:hypothetical protein
MRWSFSAHGSFGKCQRQWFYKTVLANGRAKDPQRREAHRLSKLEGIQAWRGKIVDSVISDTIIPSFSWPRPCDILTAKRKADEIFDRQRVQMLSGLGEIRFFEAEYGTPITGEVFQKARAEVHSALENFYRAESVWELLKQAKRLFPQRTLSFKHGEVTVQVRPDLLMFRHAAPQVVFDWKVNVRPLRDYWLQLVTGAIAVTRCTPHRDWPIAETRYPPHEIELFEVQLLTGRVRAHSVTAEDVADAEDFISYSATEMQLAQGDDSENLKPEDFSVAAEPRTCQMCSFKKLCWGCSNEPSGN